MSNVIATSSGQFDFNDIYFLDVNLDDIATALSRLPRFGGHGKKVITVAEHSLLVSDLIYFGGHSYIDAFWGLMHDATEAYVNDIPSPLKSMLPDYQKVEKKVWQAIKRRFGIPEPSSPAIKAYDVAAMCLESDWVFERDIISQRVSAHLPTSIEYYCGNSDGGRGRFLYLFDYLKDMIIDPA